MLAKFTDEFNATFFLKSLFIYQSSQWLFNEYRYMFEHVFESWCNQVTFTIK